MNAHDWNATDVTFYLSVQAESNQAIMDVNETDEEGDTFRTGVPKLSSRHRLIP